MHHTAYQRTFNEAFYQLFQNYPFFRQGIGFQEKVKMHRKFNTIINCLAHSICILLVCLLYHTNNQLLEIAVLAVSGLEKHVLSVSLHLFSFFLCQPKDVIFKRCIILE